MEVSLPYDPFVSLRNAGELCDDGRAPEIEHVVEYVIEHVIERLHVVHGTTTKRGKSCWQLGKVKVKVNYDWSLVLVAVNAK